MAKQKKPAKKKVSKAKAANKPSRKAAKSAAVETPAKGALVAAIPKATHVFFASNSQALLVARTGKKTLTLWDMQSGTETPPLKALPTFTAVALSPDNRFIAMGTSTGILAVQSTQSGRVVWKSKATGKPVQQIVFTLDGTLVVAATGAEKAKEGEDRWIRIYKVAGGEEDKAFDPVAGAICSHLALSPDGLFLAHSEVRSHSVLVWHLPTRQVASFVRLSPGRGPISGLGFGVSVRHLFVAQHALLSGWNGENGERNLAVEASGVTSMAVLERGGVLATTRKGEDRAFLDLYGGETGHLRRTIRLPDVEMGPLIWSPDGALLALPTERECWVWRAEKLA